MSPLKRLTTTATLRRKPWGPPASTSTPGGIRSSPGACSHGHCVLHRSGGKRSLLLHDGLFLERGLVLDDHVCLCHFLDNRYRLDRFGLQLGFWLWLWLWLWFWLWLHRRRQQLLDRRLALELCVILDSRL